MRKRNMKLVMDIIPNHVGNNHWMYQNYDTGWFNFRDSFVQTNFRANTVMDPYSSIQDRSQNVDGAFVRTMPDFNQKNEHIKRFLDQLYLWWIEFGGLSGYRIDTYPYPDQDYMNHLCEMLLKYYPKLVIYGETWVEQTATQVAFTKNNIKGFEKNQLPGVTDFVLCWAMQKAGYEKYGWLEGLNRVYQTLGEDYLYQDPNKNLTFLDNHDLSRVYSVLNEDFNAWKRSQNLLFTLRGMPSLYYGTEILMKGKTSPSDAYVRFDFPGGWKSDSINKFKPQGRTAQEQQAFLHIQKLAKFRAQNPVFLNGKMVHFAGKDETYSYFRYTENQAVFCIYSQSDKSLTIDLTRYEEITRKYRGMRNIFSGEVILFQNKSMILRPQASEIYELFN
jgi:glycosidase